MLRPIAGIMLLGLLPLAGCAGPEKVPLPPLPLGDERIDYSDALARLRTLSESATEAFYRDEWASVRDTARGIGETSRFLDRATGAPASVQPRLPAIVQNLQQESQALAAAANASDAKLVGDSLARIRLEIRTLQSAARPSKP